jgi:hypothetical protein
MEGDNMEVKKKRLSRQEKMNISIEHLIDKMFEIAGHNVTYNDIKDRKDDWYAQWTMSMEQSEQWKEYGITYLRKVFKWSKGVAEKEMLWFNLQWGLKYNDFNK